jgi:hypothetical protein
MKRGAIGALLLLCCAPAATPQRDEPAATRASLTISLRHDSITEHEPRARLERLLAQYDLGPWLFTREVVIDDDAIPHSHPVLTLHTRHLRDDLLLLSTFIHEQGHWYVDAHRAQVEAATADFRAMWPSLPVGFPEGAETIESSYEHLVVIALEHHGLVALAGELVAQQAIAFWATDHYRALYRLFWENRSEIWRVMRAHGLEPPAS